MSEDDLPPGMERRLSLRILNYWRSIRQADAFPAKGDIDPAAMSDIWGYCVILKIEGNEADPLVDFCGDEIKKLCGEDVTGKTISATPPKSLVANGLNLFTRAMAKRVPITYGDEFEGDKGVKVLFRSAILPLSEDGTTIDHFLCATNCRFDESDVIDGDES